MPYATGRIIHDADAYIMEVPGFLDDYLDTRHRAETTDAVLFPRREGFYSHTSRYHDRPASFDDSQIMLAKNWDALGAYRKQDRPHSMDLLGFSGQLMFTTALLKYRCERLLIAL
jgi:hypothetical protein